MWSDTESDKDYLNFGEVSQLTVDLLTADNILPVSVGVFGNWGAGKSSLLRLIEQQLEQSTNDWTVIKFYAWLYQGYDDARAALLEIIATELTKAAVGNETLVTKTKNLLGRVDVFCSMGLLAEGAALLSGVPTGGLLSRSASALGNAADGVQDKAEFDTLRKAAEDTQKGFWFNKSKN